MAQAFTRRGSQTIVGNPVYRRRATRRGSNLHEEDGSDNDFDGDGEHSKRRPPMVVDQLQLPPEELEKSLPRSLDAEDPNLAVGLVKFNHETRIFEKNSVSDHLAVHFTMAGTIVHPENQMAKNQQDYLNKVKYFEEKNQPVQQSLADKLLGKEAPVVEKKDELYPETMVLKNQFIFSSRGTQTYNQPLRDRQAITAPPAMNPLVYNVTSWDIFDTYLYALQQEIAAREAREKAKASTFGDSKPSEEPEESKEVAPVNMFNTQQFKWASKLMERMVNMNSDFDTFMAFKYWPIETVEKKSEDGSNMKLLWTFKYGPADKKTVTALCWNPYFTDMLAVGYGTYDFKVANDGKDSHPGMICIFTIKNTKHPEFVLNTVSGVMSLDFHPDHPSLLCVGCYDGTVLVFDIRTGDPKPMFESKDPKSKHTDPVWQVCWQKDVAGKNLNFFSISSDGKVMNWIMNKTELLNEMVVELKLQPGEDSENEAEQKEDDALIGLAGGTCFDFNKDPSKQGLFLVGTEEGGLSSYSRNAGSSFLCSFAGHHQAIYTVKWNPFHPGIFLTCGADWTVKLWDIDTVQPVMVFDLGCAVADISWAPFSSTVFAVGTYDRKVSVYDIEVDKHAPVISMPFKQKNSKVHITHLAFNPEVHILGVGCDNGQTQIIKLAGALKMHKNVRDIDHVQETMRLDNLMIINDQQGTNTGRAIQQKAEEALIQARKEAERKANEAKAAAAAASE